MSLGIALAERGILPDAFVRRGIRRVLKQKIRFEKRRAAAFQAKFLASLGDSPVALHPEAANSQHYELPPAFFEAVLGPRLKYSCCHYPQGSESLADAEESMLALTCERAQIADGQEVLDLGCGWGSLSLYIAERFPHAKITAVSNSRDQRAFIESRCAKRKIENVRVVTADMNAFDAGHEYDRVVSVEMFEHMRNLPELLKRVRGWLKDDGRLFAHIFCHRKYAYPYETKGAGDWMGRHFFTGGMMPAYDLLPEASPEFALVERWKVSGEHYYCTAMDWLENLDLHRDALMPLMAATYGEARARAWFNRWRLFFLTVAEFFAFRHGNEWFVGQYLMAPTA